MKLFGALFSSTCAFQENPGLWFNITAPDEWEKSTEENWQKLQLIGKLVNALSVVCFIFKCFKWSLKFFLDITY